MWISPMQPASVHSTGIYQTHKIHMAAGYEATVDILGKKKQKTTTRHWKYVMFFVCCFFVLESLATIDFHQVEHFNPVTLKNGYVDETMSPILSELSLQINLLR